MTSPEVPAKSRSRSRRVAGPKSRDDRGGYSFNCGFAPGKTRGQKFRVNSSDEREYLRRRARIAELWDRVVEDGQRYWPSVALEIAKAIARGEDRYILDARTLYYDFAWRPGESEAIDPAGWRAAKDDPLNYVTALHRTYLRYGFPIVPHDPVRYARGLEEARSEAQSTVERATQRARDEVAGWGLLPPDREPDDILGPSLHDALRSYVATVDANPRAGAAWKATEAGQVKRLIEHHADEPLRGIDRRRLQQLLDYWRGRPLNKKRPGRTSPKTAGHMMQTLLSALEAASYSQSFGWSMPAPPRDFDRSVSEDHDERRQRLHRPAKPVFTVEQLAALYRHAGPLDRLLIALGLNCGFGAAEAGRLTEQDVILGRPHPFAANIKYGFRPGQSFIRTVRPKSGVLGEWLLWDPTADSLRWGIERSREVGGEGGLIVVRDTGGPLYDTATKNAQAAFANRWTRLTERVRREEGAAFPKLPFGALRDTAADVVRQHYSDDLASMVIAHGSPLSADKLLDCYANRPFGRLFAALEELEGHFRPVFDAARNGQPGRPTGTAAAEEAAVGRLHLLRGVPPREYRAGATAAVEAEPEDRVSGNPISPARSSIVPTAPLPENWDRVEGVTGVPANAVTAFDPDEATAASSVGRQAERKSR